MELIKALGLDYKILLAQFINFAILVFVLYKFGYKPMLKFLDDRKQKIEEGINNAEEAKIKLEELATKEKEIVREAKKEALLIVEEAKKQAEEKKNALVATAKKEIAGIISEEKQKIKKEKEDAVSEVKKEISGLVFAALEKIIEQKYTAKEDKKMVETIIDKLNN